MKVLIEEVSREQDEEIIIRCHEVNNNILKLLNKLKTESAELLGYDQYNIHRLRIADVYYFEAVDNKVFILISVNYTKEEDDIYEFKL